MGQREEFIRIKLEVDASDVGDAVKAEAKQAAATSTPPPPAPSPPPLPRSEPSSVSQTTAQMFQTFRSFAGQVGAGRPGSIGAGIPQMFSQFVKTATGSPNMASPTITSTAQAINQMTAVEIAAAHRYFEAQRGDAQRTYDVIANTVRQAAKLGDLPFPHMMIEGDAGELMMAAHRKVAEDLGIPMSAFKPTKTGVRALVGDEALKTEQTATMTQPNQAVPYGAWAFAKQIGGQFGFGPTLQMMHNLSRVGVAQAKSSGQPMNYGQIAMEAAKIGAEVGVVLLALRTLQQGVKEITNGIVGVAKGIMSGDASQALHGMVTSLQGTSRLITLAAGTAIGSIFGPIGTLVGAAVGSLLGKVADEVLGSLHSLIGAMDGMVQALAQYNPAVFAQVKVYEVITMMQKRQLAAAFEPAISAWLTLKVNFLEFLVQFAPILNKVLMALIGVMQVAVNFFENLIRVVTAVVDIFKGLFQIGILIPGQLNLFSDSMGDAQKAIATFAWGVLELVAKLAGFSSAVVPGLGLISDGLGKAADWISKKYGVGISNTTSLDWSSLSDAQKAFNAEFIQGISKWAAQQLGEQRATGKALVNLVMSNGAQNTNAFVAAAGKQQQQIQAQHQVVQAQHANMGQQTLAQVQAAVQAGKEAMLKHYEATQGITTAIAQAGKPSSITQTPTFKGEKFDALSQLAYQHQNAPPTDVLAQLVKAGPGAKNIFSADIQMGLDRGLTENQSIQAASKDPAFIGALPRLFGQMLPPPKTTSLQPVIDMLNKGIAAPTISLPPTPPLPATPQLPVSNFDPAAANAQYLKDARAQIQKALAQTPTPYSDYLNTPGMKDQAQRAAAIAQNAPAWQQWFAQDATNQAMIREAHNAVAHALRSTQQDKLINAILGSSVAGTIIRSFLPSAPISESLSPSPSSISPNVAFGDSLQSMTPDQQAKVTKAAQAAKNQSLPNRQAQPAQIQIPPPRMPHAQIPQFIANIKNDFAMNLANDKELFEQMQQVRDKVINALNIQKNENSLMIASIEGSMIASL
jgi:hypothetical protein